MFLVLQGPVPVPPGLWISSCSAFLVELTVPFFSAPQNFSPILPQHRHCLPVKFSVFLPSLPNCDLLGQRVYTWLTSGLLHPVLQVLQVTPWIRLNGWLLEVFFSICTLRRTCLWCQHRRAVGNHWSLCPLLLLLLLQKVGLWSLSLTSHICPLRSKTAALTDDRIRTMSEVITGIKTVKMNAWEQSFIDLITRLRRYVFVHITPYFCTFPTIFTDWN